MPDAPYQRQLLICTYGPWCRLEGSDQIRDELKRRVKAAGMQDQIRVTKSGCLGQCGNGPMAAMWPDNVWYAGLKHADVDELFDEHVVGRRAVERLRYRPEKPGTNKTAAVREKESKTGKVTE